MIRCKDPMWLWKSCCLCSGQDNEAGLLVEGIGCSGNLEVPAVKCETMRELIMVVKIKEDLCDGCCSEIAKRARLYPSHQCVRPRQATATQQSLPTLCAFTPCIAEHMQ